MKKRLITVSAFIAVMLILSACGSKSENSSYDRAAAEDYYYEDVDTYEAGDFSTGYAEAEEAAEYDYDDTADTADTGSAGKEISNEEVEDHGSKIIRNASLDLEVDSLEAFSDNLKKTVYDYDGYLESMDINAYDSDYSESRYGYFTARIPAERLDDFLNIVSDEGTVTAKTESAEDVTLQYVDIEARISTYEAERDSLMELLDTATNLKDILTLRDKIAEVNYELDSLQSQLKTMSNKVTYSTVTISALETRTIAGNKGEKTFWSKIWDDFAYEMEDGLEAAIELLIFIITRLPVILILALIVFVIVKIIQAIVRSSKKKSMKRMQMNGMNMPNMQGMQGMPGAVPQQRMMQGNPGHFTSNVPIAPSAEEKKDEMAENPAGSDTDTKNGDASGDTEEKDKKDE